MTDLVERPQKQTRRYPWSFLPRAELHSLRRRRRRRHRRRRRRRHCRNGSLGGTLEMARRSALVVLVDIIMQASTKAHYRAVSLIQLPRPEINLTPIVSAKP